MCLYSTLYSNKSWATTNHSTRNIYYIVSDSSLVVFVLRDARGTGARGVMGSEKVREEDDWEILCRKVVSRVEKLCGSFLRFFSLSIDFR